VTVELQQVKELYFAYVQGFLLNNFAELRWKDGMSYLQRTRKPFCQYIKEEYEYDPMYEVPGETWKDWIAETLFAKGLKPDG
jgi:hypothetical protein